MNQQKPIVLIVDDTRANLALLSQYLREANYRVLGAESGIKALEQIRRLKPDIILLDVLMPGLDGFETCGLLKANPETREIPIIFLTALSDTVDKVRGFELGGVDYITKPVKSAEVLARLKTHLTIVQLQHQLAEHNQQLEVQVAERTEALMLANQELVRSNLSLEAEVMRRKQSEEEKDKLLAMVGKQSDQLTHLTNLLLDAQKAQRRGLAKGLREQVEANLEVVASNLAVVSEHLDGQKRVESFIYCHFNNAEQLLKQTQSYLASVEWDIETPEEKELRESPLLKLSAREREVLQLIIDGKSTPEIAALLSVSAKTIYTYRARILKKLGMTEMTELIQFAIRHELSAELVPHEMLNGHHRA